jgi:hypothetical protein
VLPLYGYAGIAIIITAELLLFGGDQVVGRWFTPIVWTGYVLFVDSVVYRLKGTSLIATDRAELVLMAVVSIAGWWLFEFYNSPRFWQSGPEVWWHYHNLEPNPYLRRAGYDWAFATIFPALFETAELLRLTLFEGLPSWHPLKIKRTTAWALIAVGAAAATLPLLVISGWLVPMVWLAYIFMLDPLNYLRGWQSITGDLSRGDCRRLVCLLMSGLICGVLWEFWNYWAISKWTYTVPYLGNIKLFEMPALGFLGFPPFAIECWAMYVFCRSLLGPASRVISLEAAGDGFWPLDKGPAKAGTPTEGEDRSTALRRAVRRPERPG